MINQVWQQVLKNKANGQRRGRGSVPAVNPDPRPPNEVTTTVTPAGGGVDNRSKQHNHPQNGNRNGNGNGKPSGGNSSSPKPNNGNGSTKPSFVFAQPEDPRDAQYWNDLVRLQSNRNFQSENQDIEDTYRRTSYQDALGQLTRNEKKDTLSYRENANRGGGTYSSKTAEGVGDIATNYFEQKSGLARDNQREESLASLARDMIDQGFTSDQAAAYIESVDRQSGRELDRPAPYSNAIETFLQKLLTQQKGKNGKGKGKGKGKKK